MAKRTGVAISLSKDCEDTFTYHGVTYSASHRDDRWLVSDGVRSESNPSLIVALDALLGGTTRDDELLGVVVRLLGPH